MVKWLQDHPMRQHIHESVIVTTTICDPEEPASFMPVSRIIGQCAMANDIVYQFGITNKPSSINTTIKLIFPVSFKTKILESKPLTAVSLTDIVHFDVLSSY